MRFSLPLLLSLTLFFTECKKEAIPVYPLKITTSEGGTATPPESTYNEGENATITAIADEFYECTGWTGDVTSAENLHTGKMNGDENGCSPSQKDSDGYGANDATDECLETLEGLSVDEKGCAIQAVYPDLNGVTIKAETWAQHGDTGEINRKVYGVIDESTLRAMIANNKDISTTVTTLATNMRELFSNKTAFKQGLSSWNVSMVN